MVDFNKRAFWHFTFKDILTILCSAAIPIALAIYTAIGSEQQKQQDEKKQKFDFKQSTQLRQQTLYDEFLNNIFKLDYYGYLKERKNPWAFANAYYRAADRQWDTIRKADVIQFLKEKQLIGRNNCTNGCKTTNLVDIIRLNELNLDNTRLASQTGVLNKLNLQCVSFDQVSMSNGEFSSVSLNGVSFDGARLDNVKFDDTSLLCASFNGANLTGAHFSNSDMTGAKITEDQIKQASFYNVTMPNGKKSEIKSSTTPKKPITQTTITTIKTKRSTTTSSSSSSTTATTSTTSSTTTSITTTSTSTISSIMTSSTTSITSSRTSSTTTSSSSSRTSSTTSSLTTTTSTTSSTTSSTTTATTSSTISTTLTTSTTTTTSATSSTASSTSSTTTTISTTSSTTSSTTTTITTTTTSSTTTTTSTSTSSTTTTTLTTIRYSQDFESGVIASSQCRVWRNFIDQLTKHNYRLLKINGSLDSVGVSVFDPTVISKIALALRTSSVYGPVTSNRRSWAVNTSAHSKAYKLSASGDPNECQNPGYIVRPCIDNINWGGINGLTCNAASQTMSVIFQY
ncbi:unnamed protein product [Adineta steineri]|uniref:Uncharacterized protein n=1 Tax=Adineta steineri TaxID=433720 RepID=A0A814PBN0_9BILA|nr:unnamed protein product [Adineta steineri]CAF1103473.1 unnamed protein product [Adineta steineri]